MTRFVEKKRSLVRSISALAIVAVVSLATHHVAQASVWNGYEWPPSQVTYDAHTLSTAWADAVSFGSTQWNNVTEVNFAIYRDDSSNNDVIVGSGVPTGYSAITAVSYTGSTIVDADITFRSTLSWYTGTGTPGGSQYDARSTATHEFGHFIGLGDTQVSRCPPQVSDTSVTPTMCEQAAIGVTWKRSLQQDDRDGMNGVYD